MPNIPKHHSFFASIVTAIKGIGMAYSTTRNLVLHTILGATAIGLGLFFKIAPIEWGVLLLAITCVVIAEMINSAIEIAVDLVTRKKKFRAMISKDIAAGAVLVSAINATIIGYLLFFDRLVTLLKGGH